MAANKNNIDITSSAGGHIDINQAGIHHKPYTQVTLTKKLTQIFSVLYKRQSGSNISHFDIIVLYTKMLCSLALITTL